MKEICMQKAQSSLGFTTEGGSKMKIGVIGIGNIAQKAYLPLYGQNRTQGEFIFATTNPQTKEMLATEYGFTQCVTSLEELLEQGIEACLIHAATKVHSEYIRRCLAAGVHVFVDKPIAEEPTVVAELLQLAKEKNLLLMAGFNRRFAPLVAPLKEQKDKHLLILQKHRIADPQPLKFVVYDLFLHLVDTAVYLLDEEIEELQARGVVKDGLLYQAHLTLHTKNTVATLHMDLTSGVNQERYQLISPEGNYELKELTQLTQVTQEAVVEHRGNDWATILHKRGFEPMLLAFLAALRGAQVDLRQDKVLKSHELCSAFLQAIKDSPQG